MSSLRELPESLQQINSKLQAFDMPHGITERSIPGVIELTGAYFPALAALVFLGAFAAYLLATRSFSLRGFLWGLPAGLLVLSIGYAGVIAFLIFSALDLPRLIFYYVVLRFPMFFGLVLALWVAQSNMRRKNTGNESARTLSSKLA
jgi:hypothetical protein